MKKSRYRSMNPLRLIDRTDRTSYDRRPDVRD
jgi:hypothetical protein